MSADPYAPVPPGCDDPARELLDFYLNGSLEGSEAAAVRAHLEACAACAAELEDLSRFAAAVAEHGAAAEAAWPRRMPALRWLGVAAALVVTTSVALYLTQQRRSGERAGAAAGPVEIRLDLGTGAMRDSQLLQVATLTPGAETLRLIFFPPVQPGAKYLAGVRRGGGEVVLAEQPLSALDTMGRATLVLPAQGLAPGAYEISLRVESTDGGLRSFTYPFEVQRKEG